MQVRYEPTADRVLWQVRTAGGELFAVWLTRRMLRQLWPHLQRLVTQASVLRSMRRVNQTANNSPPAVRTCHSTRSAVGS